MAHGVGGGVVGLLLAACSSDGDGPKSETGTPTDTHETGDTSLPEVTPLCADGGWGEIEHVAGMMFVDDDADAEGADGSAAAPFPTVTEALAVTRVEGAVRAIALWPGRYEEAIALAANVAGLSDTGLALQGCGPLEVTLAPPGAESPGVKVSEATGVVLAGFTVEGGRRGVWVWQGAEVTATNLAVTGSTRAGFVMDGSNSIGTLDRVTVTTPAPDAAGFGGYGFAFQRATVTLTESTVVGATGAGILIDGSDAAVTMTDISVTDTETADEYFGRGVQIQGQAVVAIVGGTFSGNHDAGVFALQPGLLTLEDVVVSDTQAARVDGSDETSGDGVAVTHGTAEDDWAEPYFAAQFTNVTVDGAARSGILLSGNGVGATLDTISIDAAYDPGSGAALAQGGPDVTGDVFDLDTIGVRLAYTPTALETDPLEP